MSDTCPLCHGPVIGGGSVHFACAEMSADKVRALEGKVARLEMNARHGMIPKGVGVPVYVDVAEGEEGENYRVSVRAGDAALERSFQKSAVSPGGKYAHVGGAWFRLDEMLGDLA